MDLPSMDDYLMGRQIQYPISEELELNAKKTLAAVQDLLMAFGSYRRITSGYRPKPINDRIEGAAPHSKHITCQACDLEDIDQKLYLFCKDNGLLLKALGLWCEERRGGWLHVQIVPPPSGKRWFNP
jgi:hypothetical protein